jgi:hypothetical protein
MVRLSILRFAQERGHTVVTASIVDDATAQLCPAHAREAMAEIVAAHDAGEIGNGSDALQEMVWTDSALKLLQSIPETSVRDSIQRRAEKKARRAHKDRVEDEHVVGFLPMQDTATSGGCPFAHHGQTDTTTQDEELSWDSAAMQRLNRVPEGFMRGMTERRVEAFARRKGETVITSQLLDEKYAEWGAGSKKQSAHLSWDTAAWQRMEQIPEFIRGMVIKEVERCAQQLGADSVTTDVLSHAHGSWSEKGVFHSEASPTQYLDAGTGEE